MLQCLNGTVIFPYFLLSHTNKHVKSQPLFVVWNLIEVETEHLVYHCVFSFIPTFHVHILSLTVDPSLTLLAYVNS